MSATQIPSERVLHVTHEEDSLWTSQEAASVARMLGFDGGDLWEIGIAAAELTTNLARHGGGGTLTLRVLEAEVPGLELLAEDEGPGFSNIEAALKDGISEGQLLVEEVPPLLRRGLGSGLGAIRRLTDTLTIQNRRAGGARVRAIKWMRDRVDRVAEPETHNLILGIGNTLLSDDGAGVYAARAAGQLLRDSSVVVREAEVGGFALLDLLEGYDHAIVVDAVCYQDCRPGEVMIIHDDALVPSLHLTAGHQVDLPTVLELGRRLGRPMPADVTVVGVQAEDLTTFGEQCTPKVEAAIPVAARIVAGLVRTL